MNTLEKEIELTLKGEREVNAKDKYGRTPLHYAAMKGDTKQIKILIDKGADLDAKNNGEQTPLHMAALNGNTKFVKLLIERRRAGER